MPCGVAVYKCCTRLVSSPMASKDWADAHVLTAAPPFTTAPPRGIHRLACAHPYASARSLFRPRLTWHELEKSKYAPIAKWVHAGAAAPPVATELFPALTVMKARPQARSFGVDGDFLRDLMRHP